MGSVEAERQAWRRAAKIGPERLKRLGQSLEIRIGSFIADVEVGCDEGRPVRHHRHSPDDDELNSLLGELVEKSLKVGGLGHDGSP